MKLKAAGTFPPVKRVLISTTLLPGRVYKFLNPQKAAFALEDAESTLLISSPSQLATTPTAGKT